MKAVVVYESMYGNTHRIADGIATGLRESAEVTVVPASENVRHALQGADILVVGGPTHVHGMTSDFSRRAVVEDAAQKGGPEPHIEGEALRHLLERLGSGGGTKAAAFDTRIAKRRVVTGSAAQGIARRLRHQQFEIVAEPESFLVEDTAGPLVEGELERAVGWGRALARAMAADETASPPGGPQTTIVLGYDGSEQAERAIDRCVRLADGARVVVVAVDTLPRFEAGDETASRLPLAEEAAVRLRERGIDAVARQGVGDPGGEIARIAREEHAGLVIVGGRSLTWLDRLIEGSVSDTVAHHVGADILIVH